MEITDEMRKAGSEAVWDFHPDYTIEENELVAVAAFRAMTAAIEKDAARITDEQIDDIWERANSSVVTTYAENVTDLRNFARAILALERDAVPEGWQWVPIEPTREMIEAAWRESPNYAQSIAPDPYYSYSAMLAAAPSQPGNAPIEQEKAND